ncbi:hypothetical protein [Haloferax larsenii]|uniref:Uncharacterized protein n=1 Tax=Haloferax larsenii TaxID=302484 RepID=A0A1H7FXW1_HALLR|nr:hypothetical protein [Haloferax larsenii]SEK30748.1 hypothetical protein SAMN04488691_101153 [Haloferax larsenii]
MPATDSKTGQFASALQRGILGTLLAIVAILGFGLLRGLATGKLLWGSFGLILFVGAGYGIITLFLEGYDEGRDESRGEQ